MAGHRRFSMRFSMNIIFLGWWIAGPWVMARGPAFPKPSISVSSNEIFPLGGKITIHCKNEGPKHAEFSLNKQEVLSLHRKDAKMAEQNEVVFTISDASQSNAGIYRCIYCFLLDTYHERCSDYSDEVHINIRDPSLSKPFIRVRSKKPLATGLKITLECQGPENGLNYSLYKSRVLTASQVTQPDGDRAEFHFSIERPEDTAIYTCQYSRKENPFVWSEPSDPVVLPTRGRNSGIFKNIPMTAIIWAIIAIGLPKVLVLLVLIFVLCKKRQTAPQSRTEINQ